MLDLLKRLCTLDATAGDENAVRNFIIAEIKDYCDYKIDNLGNIICFKKGTKTPLKKVMLDAHMDEVGVMITEICDDGLLRFDTVGGINVSVLEGRKLTLASEKGKLCGLVMSKAIHHIDRKDRDKANKIENQKIYKELF